MADNVRSTGKTRKVATLGDLIEDAGLTFTDVASSTGLGLTTIYRLDKGEAKARRSTVRLLAGVLAKPESVVRASIEGAAKKASAA